MPTKLTDALFRAAKGDFGPFRRKAWAVRHVRRRESEYARWVALHGSLSEERREEVRQEASAVPGPLISIVMPVYNVDERWLREALDSVLEQLYPRWELCIADDASPSPHIRRVLDEYAARDARIKVVYREANGNISAASNSALELASGEFIALMDHDDLLAEDALYQVARVILNHSDTDLIYSDEDKVDTEGRRYYPMMKPDWSPEMMHSINLVTHLCVFRARIVREIGGFRLGLEGSQDYDLALRFIERTGPEKIRHIPHILYHWRAIRGSVAFGTEEKTYAHERARLALRGHFERTGIDAEVTKGVGEMHRVRYRLGASTRVSVIGDKWKLGSLPDRGGHANIEVIHAERGDFDALNRAANDAAGDVLLFVTDQVFDAGDGWIGELAARALLPGVGAVGGRISDSRGRILHAGYFLGVGAGVGRPHFGYPDHYHGEFVRLAVDQNFSAVSADLMAVRRDRFLESGGFDVVNFAAHYADIDLCLRLAERGFRTVWTPWASIAAGGVREVPANEELDWLRATWPGPFARDPYYNSNLDADRDDLCFAFPPRLAR